MNNLLHLVRGLPGSGKSTFARSLKYDNSFLVEADLYFTKDGKYNFDYSLLNEAHEWCFSETENALMNGKNVIVSNTFVSKRFILRYFNLAKKLNVGFELTDLFDSGLTDEELVKRNLHSVPLDVISNMRRKYEKWTPTT